MNSMPQMVPVSDLRNKHKEVFSMLDEGPVLLAARSQGQAVLVGIDEWNRISEELRRARLLAESRRIAAQNDADGTWVSSSEMRKRMAKHGVVVD